ncbi:hypothetical protein MKW92_025441 [Papaver armeniacum]|nr:hypothetical protein MKW92_025441 [Papaver armeniacum]
MFFQEATFVADDWKDVHRKYDDRRSFQRFLRLLEKTGLDKYALNEDNDINISYQPNRWSSLQAWPDIVAANECYGASLLLMQLMQRIRSESGDDFKREQAKLLESFLDHLIKIQQEQRVVAYSFSEHLEQLRKSGAVAFSSDAVDDDGDRHKCPLIRSEHAMDSYIWQQKHLFDSLCTMSRESAWLLKQLKDSRFTSRSSIEESNKILDIILVFISKFKESKESLDQYLLDGCCRFNEHQIQLVMKNNEILDDFGGRIRNLQEQGVERKSVAEMLLGCFVDVVNMHYHCAERGNNPASDTCSQLQVAFSEAAKETSELINETVEKLISVSCSDLTGGGSPLGCIALWRIVFESSLINLRMDLICKNHRETIKLGDKPLDTATNDQLDQIRLSINKLLRVGESVLLEFIAMHKTVAEVSYMLGDAFTTGGKHVDQLMDFNLDDFPWDKHTIRDYFKIDVDDPRTWKWMQDNPDYLEWDAGGLRRDI